MADGEVTRLIAAAREGRKDAAAELFLVVYQELRRIAGRYMRSERVDHTLQATALVNEAYMRLTDQEQLSFENRAHFFGVAASVMRRVLIDHARAARADKRGGGEAKVPVDDAVMAAAVERPDWLLDMHLALERLEKIEPRQAKIVELRFFGGLSVEETAAALGVGPRTIDRDWQTAREWLRGQLH